MADTTNIPSSCLEGEPFVKLEDGGTAPILNYQVPQKTSFTAYGNVSMNLEDQVFSDKAREIPTESIEKVQNETSEHLAAELDQEIQFKGSGKTGLLLNVGSDISRFEVQTVQATQASLSQTPNALTTLTTEATEGGETPEADTVTTATYAQDAIAGLDPQRMADFLKKGYAMQLRPRFGAFEAIVDYRQRPLRAGTGGASNPEYIAEPRLFLIEEYVTTSFLGDYGAGQTLKTHSLFPGEKTSITVKTFQELKTVQSRAQNIIDSFAKESAAEMENLLENEASHKAYDETHKSASVEASVRFSKWSAKAKASYSSKATRESNTRNLSKALSKHVDKSNSSRKMEVNTTSESTSTQTDEVATVREFNNPNQSRVLNFVFRELLQEYHSITYLNDVKIGFTNGHPEMDLFYSLEELDELLDQVIVEGSRQEVKDRILFEYAQVESGIREGESLEFLTTKTVDTFEGEPYTYLTKLKNVRDRYEISTGNTIEVPGVILNVDTNTLRTPAVVVDALLGKGEALDCFNMYGQDSKIKLEQLEARKLEIALNTLDAITDPAQRAEMFAKIFNPQINNNNPIV